MDLYENFTVSGMYFSGDGMSDIHMDYDFGGTPMYPYGESYNLWGEELYLDGWDSPWAYDYTFSADGTTFTAVTTFNGDKGDLIYTAVWKKIPNQ